MSTAVRVRVVGISGSLRRDSFNTALLRAAAEVAPPTCAIEIASIREIPLYDADLDAAGQPLAAVIALKEKIAAAQGLLLVTPEYNYSIPGVLKNAIDWISRPARDIERNFGGRAVGLIGASSGAGGTRLAQAAWLPVLRGLKLVPFFGQQLFVANAASVFDAEGRLTDEATRKHLTAYMAGFAAFAAR
jgi:NAD(P)H-dependent FMN reductase